MNSRYDVVVVGGGIVGAACAAEFVRARLSVALVEPKTIGGAATAAGMGHLAVMDDSDAQFALTRYSQVLWRELAPQLPPDAEYFRCGAFWVAADDDDMSQVRRKLSYYRDRGVPAELLDARALGDAEPNLRPGLAGGLLLPDYSVVYPPCAAHFLVERARHAGEAAGIRGVDQALVEGEIAGYAAAGLDLQAHALFPARAKARAFAKALRQPFAPRDELRSLPGPRTIVCRCEDVPLERLRTADSWRAAKLHLRCGIGPCQGGICGPATQFLFGWQVESIRLPVFPARIASLISEINPSEKGFPV